MFGHGSDARVLNATRPVDFGSGADSLAALRQAELGADTFSSAVYVFRTKTAHRAKLVWLDGAGLCLMAKRLEQTGFRRAGDPRRLDAADGGRVWCSAEKSGLAPRAWRPASAGAPAPWLRS